MPPAPSRPSTRKLPSTTVPSVSDGASGGALATSRSSDSTVASVVSPPSGPSTSAFTGGTYATRRDAGQPWGAAPRGCHIAPAGSGAGADFGSLLLAGGGGRLDRHAHPAAVAQRLR